MDKSPDFMAQWNYQDPAASALRFHALLPEARTAANLQLELELLTQIARTYSLQRQFAEAHQLLDEIEPRLTDATPRARLRALLERGRTFNSAGDKATARTLFEQAWQLGLKSKELYLAIDAAHMIAIAAPLDEQSRWHQLAMELAERSQDEKVRGWLASLYNNQGWTLFELGRFDEARVFQQKCLAWHEQHNNTAKAFIARWSLARLTRAQGLHEQALADLKQQQEEMAEAGEPEDGYLFEELGENALVLDDPAAAEYFSRAWFLLSQDRWFKTNEAERLARLKQLAKL
ncbi:tetratricopeptide repeat protein [Aeromonas salmonicida]|uniref:tetratricopeptide repeat protein n=1 Tax=Aeromonas salmonicida TaxID=645 RepID=UPI0024A8E8FB|nr:tetratricopeptide repeat protein [Aeromonas salmonicida]MDM5137246.1 tetratricopeptide repeat protein [Aeromonas salmonicida]WHF39439.1 tetratricopeptide repeat protein [Aeromonas salmonicida]